MKRTFLISLILIFIFLISGCASKVEVIEEDNDEISLPAPTLEGVVSLEKTLAERRSRRDFTDKELSLKDFSQLLWSAQGITSVWGGRTAPSAGALYPLEIYIVVGNVENISPSVYHYNPKTHSVKKVLEGDKREELKRVALGQYPIGEAAIDIVFTAVYKRTTRKYGERGIRYVHLEAGHAAQNVYLQCESLGLGTVVIGAFNDKGVKDVLNIEEEPLYIMPIGHPS
nr:SagB/ThcOx family dehydrogenase [Nanoarchaeota archaeon]